MMRADLMGGTGTATKTHRCPPNFLRSVDRREVEAPATLRWARDFRTNGSVSCHRLRITPKSRGMASGKFGKCCRLHAEQRVCAEINPRLWLVPPLGRLFVKRIDPDWRQPARLQDAAAIVRTHVLVTNGLTDCLSDRRGDLGHIESFRAGDVESSTMVATLDQNGESDAGDVLYVDRRKLRVFVSQQQQPFANDCRGLAQVDLHKLTWTKMSPGETGAFQVLLDLLVHTRKAEILGVKADARFLAGEFHNMGHACGLGSVDEPALRFDHLRIGTGDH